VIAMKKTSDRVGFPMDSKLANISTISVEGTSNYGRRRLVVVQ